LVDNLPDVEYLHLHASQLDDEAFGLLNSGKLSRLDTLGFSGREFDDASLARLHPLSGLLSLGLSGTSVTDSSVEHIAKVPGLIHLSVRKTDVTEDGVKRLKSQIRVVITSSDY
jgi:hypothetical protein